MIYVKGIPGRMAEVEGESYLFFSGFAYLGMPSLPDFQKIVQEGMKKHGVVFPSSRVSNTRNALYHKFEEKLSLFIGMEASASFSSGYLAAQAAVQFAMRQNHLLYLPGIHPSLKVSLAEQPASEENIASIIAKVNAGASSSYTIVAESINPLTGEIADFDWLLNIKKPVRIVIDDSHGIGLLGKGGEGISALLPKAAPLRYLLPYSLSKAFSCEGGAVSGTKEDIDVIKSTSPFSAATPMSPAFVYAWMQAQEMFQQQRMNLQDNCQYLSEGISGLDMVSYNRQLPVCRILAEDFYSYCLKYHILLSAFRYPTEQDPLMARVVLNALHTRDDLDRLLHCLHQFQKALLM